MNEVLVADCVGKKYGERWVIHSASLRATAGQLRALLGRNGAGKSTLLKIGAGVVEPDTGNVRFNGRTAERMRLSNMSLGGLCYVPDHDFLSNAFTVREHLGFAATLNPGLSVDAVAGQLGLEALLGARPHELSSGERRRAEIAFACARRPTCLLVDEPLRNLAPIDAEALLSVLRALAEGGCAVVVTGHEVPALLAAVHHVTWCTAGTTYEMGPPFMARTDERFMRDYLGTAASA